MINYDVDITVDYHDDTKHYSRSDLALFDFSPRAYKRMRESGRTSPESEALTIGSGSHAIALKDPLSLAKMVKAERGVRRGSNRWKRLQDARENRGKKVLTYQQYSLCEQIARAVGELKVSTVVMEDGHVPTFAELVDHPSAVREMQFRWGDMGVPCRLKADLVIPLPQVTLCFDLKTARSCESAAFRSEVVHRKLWLQDAHYSEGLGEKYGNPVQFVFCVVDKTPDHNAAIHMIDEQGRQLARKRRREILAKVAECEKTGDFNDPGDRSGVHVIALKPSDIWRDR